MSAPRATETTLEPRSASATLWLRELAGQIGFADEARTGLPEATLAPLFERMSRARTKAGLTAREFRSLKHASLESFCEQFQFTRTEVRFAQRTVEALWSLWRAKEIGRRLARERHRRSLSWLARNTIVK